ncbi:MAG TPA: hypothetical protein VFK88_05365 [Gallionella sp.]|nr:hypothetical protein [Gallionella sp.]
MASVAQQNFVSFLNGWVKDFIQNLSGVSDNLAQYYRLSARIHAARSRVLGIQSQCDANKAEFEANEQALHAALLEIAEKVVRAIKPSAISYLIAIINEWNKSDAPDRLAKAITVYDEVLALVRRYKNRLPPDLDLWALVEETLIAVVAAYPSRLLNSDPQFKNFTEDARALSGVETLTSELRNLFRINLFDADPALFEINAAVMERLNGEIGDLQEQANEARGAVVEALSAIADVIARLAENAEELKPEEAREAVRKYLVAPIKAIPGNGFSDELVPDATKNIKSILKHEGGAIGDEVERRIWEQLRESSPDLFPALEQPQSHPCGAPRRSLDGSCQRRTSDDYCYQHGDTPSADAQPLAGKWRMSGVQSGIEHSGWEAELTLEKSGGAKWKQTKGANAGAKRSGRWQWNRGVFILVYRASHTGRVEWEARVAQPSAGSMSGDYRTPEVSPSGTGWGGTWSAVRG